MLVSGVTEEDCKKAADLIVGISKMRSSADLAVPDMAKIVDAMRWLQALALEMAKDFKASKPEPAVAQETFKIKEYNPGEIKSGNKRRR